MRKISSCKAEDDSGMIDSLSSLDCHGHLKCHKVLALVKNRYDIFTEPQGKTFACRNSLKLQRFRRMRKL